MPETDRITFNHKEIAEVLIKHQDLHEGYWGVLIEFNLAGANVGPSQEKSVPAAIVGVVKIGLQRMPDDKGIAVDAAKVNPPKKSKAKK